MVADKKPTRAQNRKTYGVSEYDPKAEAKALKNGERYYNWDELFKLIPDYNCYAQAKGCYFDEEAAERVCEFFALVLKHPAGTRDVPAGSPFILEPWQQAVVGCLFGWKKDGTDLRRYRKVFLYIAKKSGKSTLAAGLIIYMLTQEDERMSRLYSVAASRDQTGNVFEPVVQMIRSQPMLGNILKPYGDRGGSVTKSVTFAERYNTYTCLAADANRADGKPVQGAFVDELHRHKNAELSEVLERSSAARAQPVIFTTTTADWNRPSVCNDTRKFAIDVRDNDGNSDEAGYAPWFLPVIFETTKDDDHTDPASWLKANPNLDKTVTTEYMEERMQEARDNPSSLNNILRLHLNRVTDAETAWITKAQWDACCDPVDPATLKGEACWAALDLASTSDMTAFVQMFVLPDERLYLLPHFWVPERLIQPHSHALWQKYSEWAHAGHLQVTPGDGTDYRFIRHRINEQGKEHGIREVAIDMLWQGAHMATELQEEDGFKVTAFGQGYKSMAMPTEKFETRVVSRTVAHDGNPVLAWQASNCAVKLDPAGNKKLDKGEGQGGEKRKRKIDGMVCAVMCLGIWELNEEVSEPTMELIY